MPAGRSPHAILLDEEQRQIQVAVIHPERIPAGAGALLPDLPAQLDRGSIDQLLSLRLPD